MGKKQLKKNQKIQCHREFKTGNKSSHKIRRKSAGRKKNSVSNLEEEILSSFERTWLDIAEKVQKINKRPKSISVVSPSNKGVSRTPLPPGIAKLDPHRSVITSKEIFIADHVVEHEGAKVLLVASDLAIMVQGVTLDVQNTEDGPKLVILQG